MIDLSGDTELLARLLAARAGTSPEKIVREAVIASARAAGVTLDDAKVVDRDAMLKAATEIAIRAAARPVFDNRSDDEIIGYDEHGLNSTN